MMQLTEMSQTALKDFERCEWRFENSWMRYGEGISGTSIQMEVGSVFDAYARCSFNHHLNLDDELVDRQGREFSERALKLGRQLFICYKQSGARQALVDEGVAIVGADKAAIIGGVPFAGMPDIIMHDGIVLDWKTSGIASKRGPYIRKGHEGGWVFSSGVWSREPKCSQHGMLMEDIYEPWALQNTLYSFLLGKRPPIKNLRVGNDVIYVAGKRIYILRYRARVSEEYQIDALRRLQHAWNIISSGKIPAPIYSKRKCNMWGRTCELAAECPAYQAHQRATDGSDTGWLAQMLL